jgi:hypothetical protein
MSQIKKRKFRKLDPLNQYFTKINRINSPGYARQTDAAGALIGRHLHPSLG